MPVFTIAQIQKSLDGFSSASVRSKQRFTGPLEHALPTFFELHSHKNILRKWSVYLKTATLGLQKIDFGNEKRIYCKTETACMKKWMMTRKSADFDYFAKKYNIDPLLVRILVNKGLKNDNDFDSYLFGGDASFHDPFFLKDIDKAVEIVKKKIEDGKNIRIIGDYDVDGVCATAILVKGLRKLNANVSMVIPHRIHDGYGLNMNIIDKAHEDGVDTIITCDNGISAVNEIAKAKEYNMTVIITDHHEVPFENSETESKKYILPPADAVVDPKQEDCGYPFKGICGAFVAYKFIVALWEKVPDGSNEKCFNTDELLELAGLATVADIMELKDENRVLVKRALELMKDSSNTGLKALIAVKDLMGQKITSYHLGFVIGPCINAAGRLSSADRALDLLLCEDYREAMRLAADLSALNDNRKKITEEAVKKAQLQLDENNLPKVIVVYVPECHESVAGIVAGKLRENYCRPVFVITDGAGGAKGSGRSIETYNMYEEMTAVKDIFIKFGGHSQAAGFSLPKDKIEEMRLRLNENCTLKDDDFHETIHLDADPPLSYISPTFVNQLELMQPLGNGNDGCKLARSKVKMIGVRFMGENNAMARFRVKDSDGFVCEMIMFRGVTEFMDRMRNKYGADRVEKIIRAQDEAEFSVCYCPGWNEFNGRKSIQFVIEDCLV